MNFQYGGIIAAARLAAIFFLVPFVAPAAQAAILGGSFLATTEGAPAVTVTIRLRDVPLAAEQSAPGLTVNFDSEDVDITFVNPHTNISSCGTGCVQANFIAGGTDIRLLYSAKNDNVVEGSNFATSITVSQRTYSLSSGTANADSRVFIGRINDVTPRLAINGSFPVVTEGDPSVTVQLVLRNSPAAGENENPGLTVNFDSEEVDVSFLLTRRISCGPGCIVGFLNLQQDRILLHYRAKSDMNIERPPSTTITFSHRAYNVFEGTTAAAASRAFTVAITDGTPGLFQTPASLAASVNEGVSQTQAIRLNTRPSANVTVSVTSDDSTVLEVTGSPLTFTSINWNVSQNVVVRAIHNRIVDLTQREGVVTYELSSSDDVYDAFGPFMQTVQVNNIDNLAESFHFVGDSFPLLPEGGMITVTLRVRSASDRNIRLAVYSTNLERVGVGQAFYDFPAPGDGLVTVFSTNDDVDEDPSIFPNGMASYKLSVRVIEGPSEFLRLPALLQEGFITDDDTARLFIDPPTLASLGEGATATVSVRLASRPTTSVNLAISVSDSTELSVSHTNIVFSPGNWHIVRRVTLSGVADSLIDGTKPVTLTYDFISGDTVYNALPNVIQSLEVFDVANLILNPTSLPDLAEGGETQVMVSLETEPTATVTVDVSSSDLDEVSVSIAKLEFTAANWSAAQPVVLSGEADRLVDGTQVVEITYEMSSNDTDYAALTDVTQSLNVTDVDVAGLVPDPATLPTINEEGGTATVIVRLSTEAEVGVMLSFTSSAPEVATLTATSITAMLTTTADSATVTLGAVANTSATGSQEYALQVSVVSGPGGYSGLMLTVTGTVVDDEVPNLVLYPSSLPDVAEDGETQVLVSLAIQPAGNVNVVVASSEQGELTVSPAQLVFTTANWNVARPVTLSGVSDRLVEGPKPVTVTYDLSSSGDIIYSALPDVTQTLDVTDANEAGFVVSAAPLPDINEEGGTATVTVRLSIAAETGVTVIFTSPDSSSTLFSANSITATLFAGTLETATEATVTLGAVNDNVGAGNLRYSLKLSVSSGPGGYSGLTLSVTGMVLDDDVPNLVLVPNSLADLAEGEERQVMVKLAVPPSATVTVDVSSADPDDPSDTGEVSVSPARLEFTATNWSARQPVVLTGVPDSLVDGTQAVVVTYAVSSTDSDYANLPDVTQSLNVTDADVAGWELLPATLPTISENGRKATVTLRLLVAAETGVTLLINTFERASLSLQGGFLIVTLTTTADSATVTIGAVDNFFDEIGNTDTYFLRVQALERPDGYSRLTVDYTGVVLDDDVPGLVLDPITPSVAEGDETVVIARLSSQPFQSNHIVTVSVSSGDPDELTVSTPRLVFTKTDWNTAHPVTLSGVRDNIVDGTKQVMLTYDFSSSHDRTYNDLQSVTHVWEVTDSEEAGFTLIPASLPDINEDGGTATVTVRLSAAAESRVTVVFTSPDSSATLFTANSITATLYAATDGTVTEATVTLGAVNDDVRLNMRYSLKVSVSSGPIGYSGLEQTFTGMVLDDEEPKLVLDPPSLPDVAEGGETQVMVMLAALPTANVSVSVTSSDPGELTVSIAELVFTTTNWKEKQTVTLSGEADSLVDGTQAVAVTYALSSDDTGYAALTDVTQPLNVTDSDVAVFVSDPTPLPTINEAGGMATVILSLSTAAKTDVTLSFTSPFPAVATLTETPLRATLRTLEDSATVTLGAVADMAQTGDRTYALKMSVVLGPGGFDGLEQTVTGTVLDDDTANLVLDPPPPSRAILAEGDETQVMVKLATQPAANVTVAVSSSDQSELTVSIAELVFTASNWSVPRPVTLTGEADSLVDGTKPVTVTYGLRSSDLVYAGLSTVTQSLDVTDADVAGFVVIPASLPDINELGGKVTVTVRLSTAAEPGVTLVFTSPDAAATLFTAESITAVLIAATDEATVTLGAVNDNVSSGNLGYSLVVSVESGPVGYSGLTLPVTGIVLDDDAPNLVLEPPALAGVVEGGETQVMVKLAIEPSADVTVSVTSGDPGVIEVTGSPLTFTRTNWDMPQEVVFSAVRNHIFDTTPREVTITYELTSIDNGYSALGSITKAVEVINIDTAVDAFGFVRASGETDLPLLLEGDSITVTVELRTGAEIPVSLRVWSASGRVTLSATTLTFTFQAPGDTGLVTVFGVDNDVYDSFSTDLDVTEPFPYFLLVDAIAGPDRYVSQRPLQQNGYILEDDEVGLELAPVTLPNLPEGASSTVGIVLMSAPYGNVNVAVSVSDETELSVSHTNLVFTADDWNVAQSVTLAGIADGVVDGMKPVTVTYDTSSGAQDFFFNELPDVTQELDVTDEDIAGLVSDPETLPTINEAGDGSTATVTVRLSTAAETEVTVVFTSPDAAATLFTANSITATLLTRPDGTSTEATVTLGAVTDSAVTGNRGYSLKVSVVSGPGGYGGLELTVYGVVGDNVSPSLIMNPPTIDGAVSEGETVTQSTSLATKPSADVTVTVTSDDPGVIEVMGSPLTFTRTNWANPQEVVFSAVRNHIFDSAPREATITYELYSSDGGYSALGPFRQPVEVINIDTAVDAFGFVRASGETDLPLLIEGDSITVSVELRTGAEIPVSLRVWSASSRVTLSATTLTFTFQAPGDTGLVTVFGVDDDVYSSFSTDPAVLEPFPYFLLVDAIAGPDRYVSQRPLQQNGYILDDDEVGLELAPVTLSNLLEGASSTVGVVLVSAPYGNVSVDVSVSDETELSVSHTNLVFTPDDWNMAQSVTLTGIPDGEVDSLKRVTLTYDTSSGVLDPFFDALPDVTQELDVTNADIAGLESDRATLPTINEEGGTARVIVRLSVAAEGGVILSFTSPFPAVATLTPLLATLTTTLDSATVTLGAVNDGVASGNQDYALKVSVVSGPDGYVGLTLSVAGMVVDDDTAGYIMSPTNFDGVDIEEDQVVSQTTRLLSEPIANVTVSASSNDATIISGSQLTFSVANYQVPQEVRFMVPRNQVVEIPPREVTITYSASSSAGGYASTPDFNLTLDVIDLDEGGFVADTTTLPDIGEDGGTATVILRLTTAAEGGVALSLTSPFPAVATLTSTPLLATLTTLGDRATVTLEAVNDNIDRADRGYALQVSVVSGPGSYVGLTLSLAGIVNDDDTASLVLEPTTLPVLAEDATSTVSLSLATQPTATVTVSVASDVTTEATVTPAEIVFTADDWNTAKPVTLSGVRDNLVDGPKPVTITYDVSSSDDTVYKNLPGVTQSLEVTDVDIAGLGTDLTTLPTINENGGTATVILRLLAAAETGVELSFTSPFAAVTLSTTPLRATLTTLDDRATVTLGAVNDDTDSFTNRAYDLRVRVLSGPSAYLGLGLTITGEVIDDDVAGLVLDPPSLPGLAEGATSTVSVSLATRPGSEVTVAVASDVPTEATVTPAELVFLPGNWNTAQPVTLSGVADDLVDGNQTVTVTYNSSSSNALYGFLAQPVTQSQLVTDSDVAVFVSDPTPLPTINEAGGMATVILSLSIAAETDVALVITSPFTTVATLTSPLPLSVTLRTLGHSATVTLGAVADMAQTGDRTYALKMSVVSGPGGFDGLEQTVTGIVRDDDTAGLVLDPASLTDLAEGATSTVSVMLGSQPTADVTVAVTGSDATELSFSPASLEFTATDWNTAKTVTLSGVRDNLVDGPKPVTITYDVSSSDDTVYKNLPGVTQSLEVTDVGVAGLATDPTTLPPINEAGDGDTATVTVRLLAAAETGVELSFTSPFNAATLSSTPLLATLTTLDDRATVTLEAVTDSVVAGNRDYALKVSVVSGPGGYPGLTLSVAGMVIDNDVVNLVLDPPSLPDLAEGATSTVSVKIATRPSSAVTVTVTSSDINLLTVSTARLVFTDANWNVEQPVTLSGETDNVVDGNQTVTVTYGLSSSDPDYAALATVTQSLEVTDAEVAGLLLDPTALPDLDENGGTATVSVRLSAAAETGVKLSFTSRFGSATLTASSVTATLTTTADEAIVTLGAVDNDFDTVGNRIYGLRVSVVSGPGAYDGLTEIASGSVIDDDQANLVLTPTSLPNLAEGETATVMVNLATQTGSAVTVAVTVSDDTELSFSPVSLVFTSADWNVPKPVTLSGVADSLLDGTKQVTVTYDVSSSDFAYVSSPDVTQSLDVTDADVAGLESDPTSLPTINEAGDGSTATVTVRLSVAVETGVVLSLTSPFPAVATLTATPLLATLTTTADEATVTLGAVADTVATGNRGYALKVSVVSGPFGYAGLELTVTGTVLDDDTANLVLAPTSLPDLAEDATSTVTVMLSTQPTANVSVSISVSDDTELSFSPVSLEFTTGNWNQAQEVVVSGLADSVVDGNQTVTVTYDLSSSDDTVYGGLSDVTQTLTVTDVQVAGFEVTPGSLTLTPINEAGEGSTATVSVRLSTAAEGGVALSFTSSAPEVATLTATSVTVTLTTTGDSATVTLGAVSDNAVTGIRGYALQVSVVGGPGGYAGLELSVTGMVLDDDSANLVLDPPSLPDVAEGATSTVSVKLATQPTGDVTVAFSVSDDTELSFSPASLVFTDANWNTGLPVTLSGVEDSLVDETKQVVVTYDISSTGDSDYDDLPNVTQSLDVTDSDVAGLVSDPTPLPTINEAGDGSTATVIVRLSTAVETGVTLSLSSPFPTVATLTATPLLATLTTKADGATVTLGAVDDNAVTGNRGYALKVSVVGGPGGYGGLELTVSGSVTDDDVANLVLDPPSLPDVAEGATSTVSVKLATQPSADVTVAFSVSDDTELSFSPASLVFTDANWNTALPVTLSGVEDSLVDETKQVVVTYDISSTGDSYYDDLPNVTQSLDVTDSDVAGLVSDPTPLPTINEAGNGSTAMVIVRLSAAVETGVTLSLSSSFPTVATLTATPLLATLTTTADGATVTLGAVSDNAVTGIRGYALKVSVVGGPGGYGGLEMTFTGSVTDDDVANLVLDPPSLPDVAEGATSTVSVKLATQPTGDVTVAFSVSDDTELSFSPASLVFTDANWNTALPVTLSGVEDSLVDETKQVVVTYDISSTGDSYYDDLPNVTQSLDVTDSDVAGLVSDPTPLPTINEAGDGSTATVIVRLSTAVETGVTLSLSSSFPTVATLTATPLLATLTTKADGATVTLGAVDDNAVTGNRGYALKVSVVGGPGGYGGLEMTFTGMVLDDDVANLVLDPPSLPDVAEGATSTVSVKLATQPSADVTVAFSVSDATELSFSPASLVFTDANWNTGLPVTLSGVEDSLVDETKQVVVTYDISSTGDSYYDDLPNVTQSLDVTDSDVAGLVSDPTPLPTINEAGDGSTATVTVRLSVAVETGVTLSLSSSFPTVATLTATPLLRTEVHTPNTTR